MRVVLDTNVIISGIINPNGRPGRLVHMIGNVDFTMYCDDRIYAEYVEVLHREKFGFDKAKVSNVLARIRQCAIFVNAPTLDIPFTDPSDKKFYEVAKHCDAVLITGNRKHFPDEPFIKSVSEI